MPSLLHLHWLWVFGALSLGIVVGWLTYLFAATQRTPRPVHIAAAVVAVCALLVAARIMPARYGLALEVGVFLAVVGAIGCVVGWALRDLAEFTPSLTRPGAAAAAAVTDSYLFRDALAEMGAGSAYMRATTGHGGSRSGPARVRPVPSAASLAQAPAPGGYTFPQTLPFADATTRRRTDPATGPRRHWSWPA